MKIKIALIDSGVDLEKLRPDQKPLVVNAWKGSFENYNDLIGHGTECAKLIFSVNSNVTIFNLKVFDRVLTSSSDRIIEAISWCIQNKIQVINLSVSINDLNYYYEFNKICDEAYQKNIIIIASADNLGRECLPAHLKSVIGVGAARVNKRNDFFYVNSSIQIYGDSLVNPRVGSNLMPYSTSYATARITGLVSNIISKNPFIDFERLNTHLMLNSKEYVRENIIISNPNIDFTKCTSKIKISGDVESVMNELKNANKFHITKNEIRIVLLINLTTNQNFDYVESLFLDMFTHNRIVYLSLFANSKIEKQKYKIELYKSMPIELCASFGKAVIDNLNNESDKNLIVVVLNKPIIPLQENCSNFFDMYSVAEISLLFGIQADDCIPIINEQSKIEYVKRNVECLRSLFNIDVPFILYNSLQNNLTKEFINDNFSDFEQLKLMIDRKYVGLKRRINNEIGLKVYGMHSKDDIQLLRKLLLSVLEKNSEC